MNSELEFEMFKRQMAALDRGQAASLQNPYSLYDAQVTIKPKLDLSDVDMRKLNLKQRKRLLKRVTGKC